MQPASTRSPNGAVLACSSAPAAPWRFSPPLSSSGAQAQTTRFSEVLTTSGRVADTPSKNGRHVSPDGEAQASKKPAPLPSPRQLACLRLAAQGKTSIGIAHALGISHRTVDEYIADACRRLGVRN